MIPRFLLAALAPALVLPPARAAAQSQRPLDVLESFTRAKSLLDSAVAAHGGVDALRAVNRLHVVIEGQDFHRNQSRRVAAPYDSTPRLIALWTDLPRGRLVNQQTSGYPGGFLYTTRFVSDSAKHWFVDVRNATHSPQNYPPPAQQFGNLFQVPQGYLLAALEGGAPGQRRYLGRMRLGSGAVVEAIAAPIPNSAILIGLDPATKRLRSVMSVGFDPFTGESAVETEFHDYRTVDGMLLPSRATLRRTGEIIRSLRYVSARRIDAIPDSLLTPPAGSSEVAQTLPGEPVRVLAPGVWAVRGGNSWGMLVEFADHLVVVDAAPNVAPTMIERAKTLAPGKPIRWVIPTHHHDDHFGGVRHYAAEGATTVTTRGNVDYFRRIVAAPASSLAPGQVPPQPGAKLEVLDGKRRVFTDGTRTLEIHDIGPSPHADEMLVAWIPSEGILFQGDLIESPPSGIPGRGANAETTMQLAEFIRRQGWQVRTFGGVHAFLASPQEFANLTARPILGLR